MRKLVISVFFLLALPALASAQNLFNAQEQSAPAGHPYRQAFDPLWQRVLQAEKQSPSFNKNGDGFGRIDRNTWRNLVQYASQSTDIERLQMVNGYFNQCPPKQDSDAWQTPEYWCTPREFMKQRGGDCEDYAIAKYFALRYLGFEARHMRIVIVRQRDEKGTFLPSLHAVLAVHRKIGGKDNWYILDNNARPRDNIFPHLQYGGRFVPLYSINEDGAWVHGK
ncbi:transglutaminase-like cysteine peptidase [Desulfovibrio sp. OttesenSCG-928-C06]|nr:transglutaminase-like cysteine peptidase [Desulfovibrio sp. OttesenSCG-928-C06]